MLHPEMGALSWFRVPALQRYRAPVQKCQERGHTVSKNGSYAESLLREVFPKLNQFDGECFLCHIREVSPVLLQY